MSTAFKKNSPISVRFSHEERKQLMNLASINEQTLSEFIRESVLNALEPVTRPIVPEVNRYLYFELGKITECMQINGLNNEAFKKIKELIDEIRLELIGLKQ